jgi:hypothetical protein
MGCRVGIRSGGISWKSDIVRMDIDQGHAGMARDPVEFGDPDLRGSLSQEQEEGGILGQRVGKFDVAGAAFSREQWGSCEGVFVGVRSEDPEGKNRTGPVGLGFKGVGVEGGGVV